MVIDTHVALWLAASPGQLSGRAKKAVREARTEGKLAISCVTLWELAMLADKGRLGINLPIQLFLRQLELSFVVVPITSDIAARSVEFSLNYPNDPMDRIIGATALVTGSSLITKDDRIRRSKEVSCIW